MIIPDNTSLLKKLENRRQWGGFPIRPTGIRIKYFFNGFNLSDTPSNDSFQDKLLLVDGIIVHKLFSQGA